MWLTDVGAASSSPSSELAERGRAVLSVWTWCLWEQKDIVVVLSEVS